MTYSIRIDRTICAGHEECVNLAPEVFRLDDEGLCVAVDPEGGDDEAVLDAARACPVDAITLIDEYGDQVWP
jgi:ferredoxin